MKKKIVEQNKAIGKKRSLKVKTEPQGELSADSEPKIKKERKPRAKSSGELFFLDDRTNEVYNQIDPQLDKFIKGKVIKIGKLKCQYIGGFFIVNLIKGKTEIWRHEVDEYGKTYPLLIEFLSKNY